MSQEQNFTNDLSNDANYISTIKTYIEPSSSYLSISKKIFNLSPLAEEKLEFEEHGERKISLDDFYSIIFDKTILSSIRNENYFPKDYRFIFFLFLNLQSNYHMRSSLGCKSISKFFRKFFNSCVRTTNQYSECDIIFSNTQIVVYINYFVSELYKLLLNKEKIEVHNAEEIAKININKITKIENLDHIYIKYMKLIIKYTLAFCNIFESTKDYPNYHKTIYETFMKIKDKTFHEYYMKQLYKIYINKGIYSLGDKFVKYIFSPIINLDIKDFKYKNNYLIESILSYRPIDKNNSNNSKDFNYTKGTPYYFLNIIVLNKIMNNFIINKENIDDKKDILLNILSAYSSNINLFVDDGNQMKVAELLLTDTVNKKPILYNLIKLELVKPYINNIQKLNSNQNYWKYFEYLFYDLCIDIYIQNSNDKKDKDNKNNNEDLLNMSNSNLDITINASQDANTSIFNSLKEETNTIKSMIVNRFNNSNDYLINKFFTHNGLEEIKEESTQTILSQKSLEELFIMLDMVYYVSTKFNDKKIIKNSIDEVKKIIIELFKQINEKGEFNCTFYNFLLNIEPKYIPDSDDNCPIFSNNSPLLKKSYDMFIITFPLFVIFIINYFSKNNNSIDEFFKIIKAFITGYSNVVFSELNNKGYDIYQLNYLYLINFIIKHILIIYIDKNDYKNNTNIKFHLPYCIKCKKKLKNPIIISRYLSQCIYCGEKNLFINADIYSYLNQYKEYLETFIKENLFRDITKLTCNLLNKFYEKYQKRNEVPLLSYNYYYKLMEEHFKFLNDVQFIIGENIPFAIEEKLCLDQKEVSLEVMIDYYFDNVFTNEDKYPFDSILALIHEDKFDLFNQFRKTIKHECGLIFNKYSVNN